MFQLKSLALIAVIFINLNHPLIARDDISENGVDSAVNQQTSQENVEISEPLDSESESSLEGGVDSTEDSLDSTELDSKESSIDYDNLLNDLVSEDSEEEEFNGQDSNDNSGSDINDNSTSADRDDNLNTDSVKKNKLFKRQTAYLKVLDKNTGLSESVNINVGSYKKVGSLYIMIRACYSSSIYDKDENVSFVQVLDKFPITTGSNSYNLNYVKSLYKDIEIPEAFVNSEEDKDRESVIVFSGWMYSLNKERSIVHDPRYDVTIIKCK